MSEVICLLAHAALLQASEPALRPLLSTPQSFSYPSRPHLRASSLATWYIRATAGLLDIAALLGLTASPERTGAELPLEGPRATGNCSITQVLLGLCQGDPLRLPRSLSGMLKEPARQAPALPPLPPQWTDLYEGRLFHALARTLGSDGISGLPPATVRILDGPVTAVVAAVPGGASTAAARHALRGISADEFAHSAADVTVNPLLLLPSHAAALVRSSPAASVAFMHSASALFRELNLAAVLRDQAVLRAIVKAGLREGEEETDEAQEQRSGVSDEDRGEVENDEAVQLEEEEEEDGEEVETAVGVELTPPRALLIRLGVAQGTAQLRHVEPPENLPIAEHFDAVLWAIAQCSFSVILTETGSGKTVSCWVCLDR